jgi:hypothetical protein
VDYKERIRSLDHPQDQDPGNSTITFREERCSNQTHVSTTIPDTKLANKQNGMVATDEPDDGLPSVAAGAQED